MDERGKPLHSFKFGAQFGGCCKGCIRPVPISRRKRAVGIKGQELHDVIQSVGLGHGLDRKLCPQQLARMEQPCLHRIFGAANDMRDVRQGQFLKIAKPDDFAVFDA